MISLSLYATANASITGGEHCRARNERRSVSRPRECTRWSGSSTTPGDTAASRVIRITHPFHPLSGRELTLVEYRCSWREYRVWFHDDDGQLSSIPAEWTSIGPADPVVAAGKGRCPFRVRDLLALVELIHELAEKGVTKNASN